MRRLQCFYMVIMPLNQTTQSYSEAAHHAETRVSQLRHLSRCCDPESLPPPPRLHTRPRTPAACVAAASPDPEIASVVRPVPPHR